MPYIDNSDNSDIPNDVSPVPKVLDPLYLTTKVLRYLLRSFGFLGVFLCPGFLGFLCPGFLGFLGFLGPGFLGPGLA